MISATEVNGTPTESGYYVAEHKTYPMPHKRVIVRVEFDDKMNYTIFEFEQRQPEFKRLINYVWYYRLDI